MRFFRYIVLICVAVISGNAYAQSQKELIKLMHERNEYYFTINVNNPNEIQAISKLCSVDGTDGRTVVCYANQREYDNLLQAGYQPNLQTPPSLREEAKMWDGNRATYEWDSYPTYEQYESMMQSFGVIKKDRSCSLIELGSLSSDRRILGIRINNGSPEGKPKFLYSSTIHGDETTGWILMLRLIDEFCTSTDSRIINLIDNLDIFIFPNTNPDGTYYGGNNTVTGARRYNANSVDMNRNYPDPHGSEHPDGNAYQTETGWFMQLAEDYPFTMAANFHGGSELVNYPWDNTYTRHADDAWWQYVSREYADLTHEVSSSYMTDENNGITNGADWYTIGGGRQDYMNGYRQCREVTIECSTTKSPNASQLPNFWNYNHNAMLAYMEQCLNGIHGVVLDANTNQPIDGATITVQDHDDEYSIVSSHEVGDFHRPIKGGTWTLEISKNGYHTETVSVTVGDDQRKDITVYLTPIGANEMTCYEQLTPSTASSYVMGYLNGSTLVTPSHNNSSTVTSNSLNVTVNDNGFSVETETTVPQVTLTAYGNDQYYISYNGRYLAKNNYGNSLTWGTSQSQYGRWHIDANGIYLTTSSGGMGGGTSTNYYLYYNNGSFALSTSSQNNIHFYTVGECPTPIFTISVTANPAEGGTVTGADNYAEGSTATLTATANDGFTFVNWTKDGTEVSTDATYSFTVTEAAAFVANFEEVATTITQTSELNTGWNWWTPGVDMDGATLLSELETNLGSNGVKILAQNGQVASHSSYGWSGSLTSLEPGKMYMIQTNAPCTFNIEGAAIDLNLSITLVHGTNWIGFFGTQETPVATALSNLQPTIGDKITSQSGASASYSSYGWGGTLQKLVPGEAYFYESKATNEVTFTFNIVQ